MMTEDTIVYLLIILMTSIISKVPSIPNIMSLYTLFIIRNVTLSKMCTNNNTNTRHVEQ